MEIFRRDSITIKTLNVSYMYHLYPILFALRNLEWDLSGDIEIQEPDPTKTDPTKTDPTKTFKVSREISLKSLMNQWKPIESYLRHLHVIKSQDFRELQQFARDYKIDYEYPAFDPHNRIGMMLVWRQRFFWNGRTVRLSPQKFSVLNGFRLIQNLRWTLGCFSVNDSQTALCVLHRRENDDSFSNEKPKIRGLSGTLETIREAIADLSQYHETLVVPSVTFPVIAELRMDQTIQPQRSTVMVSEFRLDLQDVILSSQIILNEIGLSINPQNVREMVHESIPPGYDLSQSDLLIWIENLGLPEIPIVILKYEK